MRRQDDEFLQIYPAAIFKGNRMGSAVTGSAVFSFSKKNPETKAKYHFHHGR